MKPLFLGFALALLFSMGSAQALRLTDGLYFTVMPNSSAELYFILPDDVGGGQDKADYFITNTVGWDTDLTDHTVTTDLNNTVKVPIKFYSSGKKEGDCSNYIISISAPSLKLSRSWKGGVCLSKFMDADISPAGGENALDVLNDNVDLFSLGFRAYSKVVKPWEPVSLELLLQSQSSLTIDVAVDSRLPVEKTFTVQTGGSQQQVVYLNASSVPGGSYDVVATAKARGCTLGSCTKQTSMKVVASEAGPQEGFSLSIFPDNLAIKKLEPIGYVFTIQNNYRDERTFFVAIEKPSDMDSTFISEYVTVPSQSQKSLSFTVTPRNQTGFYEIKMAASARDVERTVSAYLSTNEMVSDVSRNAEDAKSGANSSTKAGIDRDVKNWYSSYTKSESQNSTAFASLQVAIDAAKKQAEVPDGGNQDGKEPPEQPASSLLNLIIVAVALGTGVVVILLLFRKRGGEEKDDLDSLKI
jgi:hypothetical protein